jgi:hypothetical protein
MSEQKSGKVVHGKPQLVSIRTGLSFRPERPRSDPGIADEDVEPLMPGKHRRRELPRSRNRRQVGPIEDWLNVSLATYLIGKGFGPCLVAAVDQDVGAGRGQFGGDIAADAIGRAGNQNRLAVHFHREASLTRIPQKHALGLDPGVGTGFANRISANKVVSEFRPSEPKLPSASQG